MSLVWKPTIQELATAFQTSRNGSRYPFGRYRLVECQAFRDAVLKVPGVAAVTIDETSPDFLYVTIHMEGD